MTNDEGGIALADDVKRAVANELGWAEFRSRSMTSALRAGPIYVRGTMNKWSTAEPLSLTGPGTWSSTVTLQPGDYSFKVACEDWRRVVFGSEDEQPILDAVERMLLAYGANDVALKVTSARSYRFTRRADDSGKASLSISPE